MKSENYEAKKEDEKGKNPEVKGKEKNPLLKVCKAFEIPTPTKEMIDAVESLLPFFEDKESNNEKRAILKKYLNK